MTTSIPSLLADELGVPESRARELLGAMIKEIRRRVRSGNGVRIQDFGTFRKENGRVQFIPDRSLARSINHRFEGLEPETLYLEKPSQTPTPPYPRPPSEDFDFETDMASGAFEIEETQPVESFAPSVEAASDPTPDVQDAPHEDGIPDEPDPDPASDAPASPPPDPTPEALPDDPPSNEEDETMMEDTETKHAEPTDTEPGDTEPTDTEPTDTDLKNAEPEDADASEAARTGAAEEPSLDEDEAFFPSLNRIIGVEEPDEEEDDEPSPNQHPLAGIMNALSDSPDAEAGDATEAADEPRAEEASSSRRRSRRGQKQERSDFYGFGDAVRRASNREETPERSSSPRRSTFPPSHGSSDESSRASSWTDQAGPILSGVAVVVLLALGVWFVVGQYTGEPTDPLALPNSSLPTQTGPPSSSDNPEGSDASPRYTRNDPSAGDGMRSAPGMNNTGPSERGTGMPTGGSGGSMQGEGGSMGDRSSSVGLDPSRGGWTIVVRSRRSQEAAARWLNEHREQFSDLGFQVDVLPGRSDGRMWHRVAVGQFPSAAQAQTMMDRYRDRFPNDAWLLQLTSSSPTR